MSRDSLVHHLNRVLHGTVNSALQYYDISAPYVPPGFEEKFREIVAMKREEQGQIGILRDLIDSLDGVPKVGPFPYWNLDINYLDARFMAEFAARHAEGVIAETEAALEQVRHEPRVAQALKGILAQKRAHLARLRELGVRPPPAAPKAPPAPPAKPAHR